jgi:uncharacterized protein YrrD
MRFKDGTPVVTADDHRVGDIARVVINPHTREVTHIIVRKGFLFADDSIVPIELVESAGADEVRLRHTKEDMPELQALVEQHFVPIDELDEDAEISAAQPLISYPPVGGPWWGMDYVTYMPGQVVVESEPNLPEGSLLLNQGARVTSADGKHVGDIDEVITEPDSGKATHFVVAAGLFFKERKLIPTGWIQKARTDEVLLSVRASVLEGLPDYKD